MRVCHYQFKRYCMKDINEYVIGDEEFDLICKYIKIKYESKMSQRD